MSTLYYCTSNAQRYNERTLALANKSPQDTDVFILDVTPPSHNPLFQSYSDTGNAESHGAVYRPIWSVYYLPLERVIENVKGLYLQSVSRKRTGNITAGGHEILDPVLGSAVLSDWKTALEKGWGFTPTPNPFVAGTPDPVDATVLGTVLTEVENHLAACDTVADEVETHLAGSTAEDLMAEDITTWVQARYDALMV